MTEQVPIHNPREADDLFLLLPKVGLVGRNRVGKGLASTILGTMGFCSVTLSDAIRQYASESGIPLVKREDFWNTRIRMDEEMGDDVLLWKSAETAKNILITSNTTPTGIVFDGVRTHPVAKSLRALPHSSLLEITASPEVRYARRIPERSEDNLSFEEFLAYDRIEQGAIQSVRELVDHSISNEGSINEFTDEILIFLRNTFTGFE